MKSFASILEGNWSVVSFYSSCMIWTWGDSDIVYEAVSLVFTLWETFFQYSKARKVSFLIIWQNSWLKWSSSCYLLVDVYKINSIYLKYIGPHILLTILTLILKVMQPKVSDHLIWFTKVVSISFAQSYLFLKYFQCK